MEQFLDDLQSGYSETGTGWTSAPVGYGNECRYTSSGNGVAAWQFNALPSDSYTVEADWNAWPTHVAAAIYQIYDGAVLLQTVSVDQRPTPNGASYGGVPFQLLATVQVSSGTLKVVLSAAVSGDLVADAIRVASAGAPTPPALVQAAMRSDGTCEVAFEPVPFSTAYHVYRDGVLAAIVPASVPPFYLDPTPGVSYQVSSENGAGESVKGPMFTPIPFAASGISGSTVLANGPARHDVLADQSGNSHLSHWSNLHYTRRSIASQGAGPTSQAILFDDQFTGANPQATLIVGTQVFCGGGGASFSGEAVLRYPGHVPAPNFAVVVDVASSDSDVLVGYGLDRAHGVFARYSAKKIDVFGVNGATETAIVLPVTALLSGAWRLALECCNSNYAAWLDDGDGWSLIGAGFAADGGDFDLRSAAQLALWSPVVALGTSGVLARMRCVGFGGSGMMREMCPVTYPDGTPAKSSDGLTWLCADRCGPVPPDIGNVTLMVGFSVHNYDPEAGEIVGGPVASVSQAIGGRSISSQDAKIVYDPDAGGYHVWSNDWSAWSSGSFPIQTNVYYQFYTGPLSGFIHLGSPVQVALPSLGGSWFYGVDVFRANGRWYAAGTVLGGSPTVYTAVVSGDSPNNFDTLVASDTSRTTEGLTWLFLGSRIYLLGGEWNGSDPSGLIQVWDFSDLAHLNFVGLLDYPNPDDTSQVPLAQQPTIVWYAKAGRMVPQLLGFKNEVYSRFADEGPMQVCEPSFSLDCWQFPFRKASM